MLDSNIRLTNLVLQYDTYSPKALMNFLMITLSLIRQCYHSWEQYDNLRDLSFIIVREGNTWKSIWT